MTRWRLFFLLMFQGKNLSTLTRENLVHYLRLFSREMEFELSNVTNDEDNFMDSKKKVEYLKALLAKNKNVIKENIMARKSKVMLNKNKLNYITVNENQTHKFLVYLYGERFKERLECSKVLFCSENISWNSIKCNCLA